jgi:Ku protein
VTPRDPVGIEAYAVIRDAMKGKDMVGMGRVILSKRERPIIIEPDGAGIRGMTLRYNHEVRDKADYFDEIPPIELPQEMLELAEHILATKAADFDPAFLEDRYRTVLVEMLRGRQADEPRMSAAPSRDNVVNLMDALKRSLAAERPRQANVPKPTPRRAATAAKAARAKKTSARSR